MRLHEKRLKVSWNCYFYKTKMPLIQLFPADELKETAFLLFTDYASIIQLANLSHKIPTSSLFRKKKNWHLQHSFAIEWHYQLFNILFRPAGWQNFGEVQIAFGSSTYHQWCQHCRINLLWVHDTGVREHTLLIGELFFCKLGWLGNAQLFYGIVFQQSIFTIKWIQPIGWRFEAEFIFIYFILNILNINKIYILLSSSC